MNRWVLILVCGLLAPPALHAQVTVGMNLSQDQFLPGEMIPVSVRITNFSGRTLSLGADNQWLQFSLEAKTGYPVARIRDPEVRGEFQLENASIATKRLDLTPCFELLRPGRYMLKAYARIPGMGEEPLQLRQEFDVIQGTTLWEQAFGVPVTAGSSQAPEIRRYGLQQAVHLKQMKLYLRVTDQSGGRTIKVFPLGPLLTFSAPEQQIDKEARLHVLYQYGARSFYYYLVAPDGEVLVRQTHDYAGASRPRLRMTDDGKIAVRGGVRRPQADDLPPSEPTLETTSTNAPPPATNAVPAFGVPAQAAR